MFWRLLMTVFVLSACSSSTEPSRIDSHPSLSAVVPAMDASSVPIDAAVCDGASPPWRPLTHLPGTLLRDVDARYWIVDRWPDRREILARFLEDAPYRREEAIPLSAEEARCLRPTTALWYPRFGWRLIERPDGSRWYVDTTRGHRRTASSAVIRSWRDSEEGIEPLTVSDEEFEYLYRDIGPMSPPDGSLFVSDGRFVLYSERVLHLFEDASLPREVGYDTVWAIPASPTDLEGIGLFGATLTRSTFSVCPLAAAQLRETEDHDEDGIPFFRDCDDDNARRAPGQVEICDGIDNDCDLVVDNGFHVGYRCTMDDACHTQTYTRCSDDRLGVVCRDEESSCNR